MNDRKSKIKMPKEDVTYLEAAQKIFNEMGLKSTFEVSYDCGEGAYDFFFDTDDEYIDCLQIGWVNAETATKEWAGFDGQEVWPASWSLYDEVGVMLIESGITPDFGVIIDKLKEIIGGDKLGDFSTITGLRDHLNTLIEAGKGHYSIIDYKGVSMLQKHAKVHDDREEIIINARLENE